MTVESTISDIEAIALHGKLRAMPALHYSDEGDRGCDKRAYTICQLARRHDPRKAWLFACDASGKREGYIRIPEAEKPGEELSFNFHVAPLIKTGSGKTLVLDPYFFETPPTLQEWVSAFQPTRPDKASVCARITPPDVHTFRQALDNFTPPAGLDGLVADFRQAVSVRLNNFVSHVNPHPLPLRAAWVSNEMLKQAGVAETPRFLKNIQTARTAANGPATSWTAGALDRGFPEMI